MTLIKRFDTWTVPNGIGALTMRVTWDDGRVSVSAPVVCRVANPDIAIRTAHPEDWVVKHGRKGPKVFTEVSYQGEGAESVRINGDDR